MTDAYVLDRSRWTAADFDAMGWHDATIHGIAFRPDVWELALDLDYILRWVEPVAGESHYRFWVAPATLIFENVSAMRFQLECQGAVSLQGIERGSPESTRPDFKGPAQQWPWVLDCNEGEIALTATGYRQIFRQPPRLQAQQSLSLADRGGVSFAEDPPAMAAV